MSPIETPHHRSINYSFEKVGSLLTDTQLWQFQNSSPSPVTFSPQNHLLVMPSCLPHALCTPHQECLCSPPETLPGTEGGNSPPSYFQTTMGQLSDPRMNSTRRQYLTHLTVVPLDPCSPLGKPLSKVTQRTLAHLVRKQVLASGHFGQKPGSVSVHFLLTTSLIYPQKQGCLLWRNRPYGWKQELLCRHAKP